MRYFQDQLKDLAYALAGKGLALANWKLVKPFINCGAVRLPPVKLSHLVPEALHKPYKDYISDYEDILEEDNCTCLDWFGNLPMSCMANSHLGKYLPQHHGMVMDLLANATKAIKAVMERDPPGPAGDANYATVVASGALGSAEDLSNVFSIHRPF